MPDITRILAQVEQGDPQAAEQLLPLVYKELRKLAAARLAREKPGHTLQPTALVHEAYLRLVGAPVAQAWQGSGHFFAAAAEAMRRILIDAARKKQRQRHGGQHRRCELLDVDAVTIPISDELLDLDAALTKLAAEDPAGAELVQLRVFAGLTVEDAATVQGISTRTAKRNWAYARAWLGRELAAYAASQE